MIRSEQVLFLCLVGKLPQDERELSEWLEKEELEDLFKVFQSMGELSAVGISYIRQLVAVEVVRKDSEAKYLEAVLKGASSYDTLVAIKKYLVDEDRPLSEAAVEAVGRAYLFFLAKQDASVSERERATTVLKEMSRLGDRVLGEWMEKHPKYRK